MCKVIVDSIKDGLIPTEKVVRIPSATGGSEELSLSIRQVINDKFISASEIAREGDHVLVELPRETATGLWRMWVNVNKISA